MRLVLKFGYQSLQKKIPIAAVRCLAQEVEANEITFSKNHDITYLGFSKKCSHRASYTELDRMLEVLKFQTLQAHRIPVQLL